MRAILEFNLEEPEERIQHLRCIKSLDLALCVQDFIDLSKQIEKQEDRDNKPMTAKQLKSFIKTYTWDKMEDYNINIHELVQ